MTPRIRSRPRGGDLVPEEQVAVADHRDRHRRDDLGDRIPLGGVPIARVAGPAVHEHRLGAGVDGGARRSR